VILKKQRNCLEADNWSLLSDLQTNSNAFITRSEFMHFWDFINPHIQYTKEEEEELSNLIEYFTLPGKNLINIAQYIYSLDKNFFPSNVVITAGLSDNGRLGIDEYRAVDMRTSTVPDYSPEETELPIDILRNKYRIQNLAQVSIPTSIKKVSCGHKFTIALDSSGGLWSWGYGGHGCLGDGSLEDKWSPKKIDFSVLEIRQEQQILIDISAGFEHCLAINACNDVFSWGKGKQGRLGHGTEEGCLLPKIIKSFSDNNIKVVSISAGQQHSACITEKNKLYTWGCGNNYRLGHGTLQDVLKPKLLEYIDDHFIAQISCGSMHTLCLTTSGQIYAWGSGLNGRLGVEITKSDVQMMPMKVAHLREEFQTQIFSEVFAGPYQSFALTNTGQLYAWGSVKFKTLGISGQKKDVEIPTLLKSNFFKFYINSDSKDRSRRSRIESQCENDFYDLAFQQRIHPENDPLELVRVFCGETNTVFLMSNGDIYICGSGQNGQLCIKPLEKAEEFAYDKLSRKEMFAEGETIYFNTPLYMPINLNRKFKYVAVGLNHIIAITIEGKAFAWGKNTEAQLGLGYISKSVYKPTLVEVASKKFTMAAASATFSALLTDSGEVWVFGSGESGCLGANPKKLKYSIQTPQMINNIPAMKYISCGNQHMASITTCGDVYVWGNNSNGRLGIGGKSKTLPSPTRVQFSERKIFQKFQQVACGFLHTVLLDEEGTIWSAGVKAYAGFPSENSYKTLEEQDYFLQVPDLKNIKFLQVSSGEFHVLALSEAKEVYGWGKAEYGKLGIDIQLSLEENDTRLRNILLPMKIRSLENISYVSSGVNHSACVNENGDAFVWGSSLMGRLGISKSDLKTLKKLNKMKNQLYAPVLHSPHKLQEYFEEGKK